MKTFTQSIRANPYVRGGMALSVASFGVGFLNYITNTLIARGLGSGGYGEFATAVSYTALLAVPLSTISAEIIKKIQQRPQPATQMWSRIQQWEQIVISRTTSYIWLLIFLPIIVYVLQRATSLTITSSVFLLLYILLLVSTTFYSAVAQATHEFGIFTYSSVSGALLKLIGAGIVAFMFHSLEIVFIFFLFSTLPYAAIHRTIQRHAGDKKPAVKIQIKLRTILLRRQVIITMGALLGFGLLGSIDLMILKHISDSHTLGLVGGWSLLAKIIMYVFGPLGALALLYFSDSSSEHKSVYQIYAVTAAITLGSLVALLAYSIFPDSIIQLVLGTTFTAITPHLFWAALYGFLLTCTMLCCNYFIAKNSYLALIPLAIIPLQAIALITNHTSLLTVIQIDTLSSLAVTICYLIGLLLYKNKSPIS